MEKNNITIGGGLNPTPPDGRDYDYLRSFGGRIDLSELPREYIISDTLRIKDQKDSDMCSSYALTSASEFQEGEELSPEFQFAMTKYLTGEWRSWGADLRTALKSAVKIGSLKESAAPFSLEEHGRNFVANWEHWDEGYRFLAKEHRKKSFFKVEPIAGNTADGIKHALWTGRKKRQAVFTGAHWRGEWTNAKGGVIPEDYTEHGFGHAFLVVGWKGNDLILQLSNSERIGHNGLFYMDWKIAQKELKFGNFVLTDIDQEEAKWRNETRCVRKTFFFLRDWLVDILK